jgi:hypothetical protein
LDSNDKNFNVSGRDTNFEDTANNSIDYNENLNDDRTFQKLLKKYGNAYPEQEIRLAFIECGRSSSRTIEKLNSGDYHKMPNRPKSDLDTY